MNLHGGSAKTEQLDALDGEETARRLIESGSGTITPYGVVYDNGMKLEQVYDGRFFPCYYYEPNAITVAVTSKAEPEDTEHITWLFLPMVQEEIDRALQRAGIADPADVRLRLEDTQLPDEVDVLLDMEQENLADLNALAQAADELKQLGKQLKKLGILIVQDQIWNRVTINRAEKKSTRYYMDEFHLLLKEEQTAAYSVEIWKRFRKWGGIPTAITQNIKDLLASREVENIFENSDFVLMLNQAQGDRAILAKQLNISPQQMKYVTHTEAGEGLIFYGNVVLPFVDHFPKDTELYRIMTTKPEEVSSL